VQFSAQQWFRALCINFQETPGMRKTLSLLCILIFGSVHAQDKPVDSARIYKDEMIDIYYRALDSLYKNPRYQFLKERVETLRSATDDYNATTAFVLFYGADLRQFNRDNAQAGFPAVPEYAWGMGFGGSYKRKRRIFEFHLFTAGTTQESKKQEETIRSTFAGLFELEWGYDILRNNKWNLYPYAGLGLRATTVGYETPERYNISFTHITNLAQANRSVSASVFQTSYGAGVGIERVIGSSEFDSGAMFFMKAGTSGVFNPHKKYDIKGVRYQPGIRYGDWALHIGFKIYKRDWKRVHAPF
jgi:hypothetical protein